MPTGTGCSIVLFAAVPFETFLLHIRRKFMIEPVDCSESICLDDIISQNTVVLFSYKGKRIAERTSARGEGPG
jgi:hypothetical protein